MRHYSINSIFNLPHLYDLLYPEEGRFCPEHLITNLGLYNSVLIDVSDISVTSIKGVDTPMYPNNSQHIEKIEVSKDVKALHDFIIFNDNLVLPCPECRNKTAFFSSNATNPRESDPINKGVENSEDEFRSYQYKPTISKVSTYEDRTYNVFDSVSPEYVSCVNDMYLSNTCNAGNINWDNAKKSCVDGILENMSEIRKDFVCCLHSSHRLFVDCIIHRASDICKEPPELREYRSRQKINPSEEMNDKEAQIFEKYEKLKYILVLEKIGQEPSMADLQMFDIEKYKKLLNNERFKDFSTALGLSAAGVGCGALLYLRRVFESVVQMVQMECAKKDNWNEQKYNSLRFNEKIDYLESFGHKIIPDELSSMRTQIYGKLSQGVHELSEQEAIELFPHLKYIIEIILDHLIFQKERQEKIKQMSKALNS